MSVFVVQGTPAPQGSFRPVVSRSTGKPMLKVNEQGGFLKYRADIRDGAAKAQEGPVRDGPVHLTLIFVFPRPEQHWLPANSRREQPVLRPGAPVAPTGKPDVDKVARSVMDALTGITYRDDAQVVALSAVKVFNNTYHGGGSTTVAVSNVEEPDE